MRKLRIAFLVSFAVVFMAIMVRAFVPFPTVVVCDRRAPNAEVKVSSTRAYGYFEHRHVGPCVMYFHMRRPGSLATGD